MTDTVAKVRRPQLDAINPVIGNNISMNRGLRPTDESTGICVNVSRQHSR